MFQVDAGITSSGVIDLDSGAYSTTVDVGSGDEEYIGVLSLLDSGAVGAEGDYFYLNDPNFPCTTSWPFEGEEGS